MTQSSDLEEKRKVRERKRILRRLLREKEEVPKTKRTVSGLRKQPALNQKKVRSTKPTRKERQPNYGDPEARLKLPVVGTIRKGMIPYGRGYSPELWTKLREREIERMALQATKIVEKMAEKEKAKQESTPEGE